MIDKRKLRIILPAVAVAAFGVALITVFVSQPSTSQPPLPNPNGYDDFVKAGKALVGNGSNYETKTRDELVRFVAANSNTFQLITAGLSKESRVPLKYSITPPNNDIANLADEKNLAFALKAKGYLAEKEGRTNDAARAYLDCTLLGTQCEHGGLPIGHLSAFACENLCSSKLRNIIPALEAKLCSDYAKSLERIDASAESPEDILLRDKLWSSRVYGLREKLMTVVYWREEKQFNDKFRSKYHANQQQRRQLILDLATQAYNQEHGHLPDSAKQLVPQYLKSVPIDPETGAPLKISMTPTAK